MEQIGNEREKGGKGDRDAPFPPLSYPCHPPQSVPSVFPCHTLIEVHNVALRIILVVCIFVVAGIISSEVQGWRAGTKRVTRLHKTIRVSSASLMILILGMIIAGDTWLTPYGPLAIMGYWATCLGLTTLLIILALFDLREVGINYREERRRMLRNLAQRGDHDDNT